MANPSEDVGAVIFAGLIALMMIAAGIAAMPPVRDHRIFIGAVTMACSWLAAILIVKETGDWLSTSFLVFLDFTFVGIFYKLSVPRHGESGADKKYKWASYVVALYVGIVLLEGGNILMRFPDNFYIKTVVSLIALLFIVLVYGFYRGFGALIAIAFSAFAVSVCIIAGYFFSPVLNLLTVAAISVILARALDGAVMVLRCGWEAGRQGNGRSK